MRLLARCGGVPAAASLSVFTRASGGMADALASGASVRKDVGVQVPPRPPVVELRPRTDEEIRSTELQLRLVVDDDCVKLVNALTHAVEANCAPSRWVVRRPSFSLGSSTESKSSSWITAPACMYSVAGSSVEQMFTRPAP